MSWKNIFEWLKLVLCHQKQFQANKNVLDSIWKNSSKENKVNSSWPFLAL